MTSTAVRNQIAQAPQHATHALRKAPITREKTQVNIGGHDRVLALQRKLGNRATTQVLNTSGFGRQHGKVQRKCSSCDGGKELCDECQKGSSIQRESNGVTDTQPDVAAAVRGGLVSQGQPLDPAVRTSMESYFGNDLAGVRVHADSSAGASAKQLNAHAYTIGSDIVFGSGRYQPHTPEGQRLLAHELTHTIQQSNTIAYDQIGISAPTDSSEQEADAVADLFGRGEPIKQRPAVQNFAVARQPASKTTSPPSQPASKPATQPAAAPGWTGCSTEHVSQLPGELSDAVTWVQDSITDLQATEIPRHTSNALSRYLTTNSADLKTTILPTLKLILAELKRGAANFQCQTQAQCVKTFPDAPNVNAYSGNPITICDHYFEESALDRVTILIHEAGHNANLGGDVYEWKWPFPGLDKKTRLTNADSFAAFVRSNKYPSVAPLEQDVGPKVSFGVSAPGGFGVSPRFLVRVEEDAVLKKRIFRFMDLHLGIGLEFDTSGSFLGKVSLTTRSFAPLSLTKVPFYLDLGAGAVGGGVGDAGQQFRGVSGTGLNVAGPTAEAGLGIHSGRIGFGISYTHIFNFLKSNPDINQLAVNGEILF